MVWGRTEAENALHSILWRANLESPFSSLAGKGALKWLESLELPAYVAPMRDERACRDAPPGGATWKGLHLKALDGTTSLPRRRCGSRTAPGAAVDNAADRA